MHDNLPPCGGRIARAIRNYGRKGASQEQSVSWKTVGRRSLMVIPKVTTGNRSRSLCIVHRREAGFPSRVGGERKEVRYKKGRLKRGGVKTGHC